MLKYILCYFIIGAACAGINFVGGILIGMILAIRASKNSIDLIKESNDVSDEAADYYKTDRTGVTSLASICTIVAWPVMFWGSFVHIITYII